MNGLNVDLGAYQFREALYHRQSTSTALESGPGSSGIETKIPVDNGTKTHISNNEA